MIDNPMHEQVFMNIGKITGVIGVLVGEHGFGSTNRQGIEKARHKSGEPEELPLAIEATPPYSKRLWIGVRVISTRRF